MGLVEDMLAASSARVLALYPSNDPVQVELSDLTSENKKRNKKIEEVTKKRKRKLSVSECEKNKEVTIKRSKKRHMNTFVSFDGQVEVKKEYFEVDKDEKIYDTDNYNKTKDSEKVKFEYEFNETKMKYPDEKKELLKVKKAEKNYEATTPTFASKKESADCKKINATSQAINKRRKDKSISIIKRIEENFEYKQKHKIKKIKGYHNADCKQNIKLRKSPGSNKLNDETIEDNKDKLVQAKVFRKSGNKLRTFSVEEDGIILKAMDAFGDKLNISSLVKELCTDRCKKSVRNRIDKLKLGGSQRKVRRLYSLTEDLIIMDKLLVQLHGKKLNEINLNEDRSSIEVANDLGRPEATVRIRWGNYLKPWILQHYSGTLNLDIKRMLANFLSDNFDSIKSIDWSIVAKRPEFVGHTLGSLSAMFFSSMFNVTKRKTNLENENISLKHIAETYRGRSSQTIFENVLTRQKKVIDYFEQYVKKHDITHFL